MPEKIREYWPFVSLIALAIVSIFNIGYFYRVGIHFIGVMDLTNIAYSFGLVFATLLAIAVGIPYKALSEFDAFARTPKAVARMKKMFKITIAVMALLFTVSLFVAGDY